MPEIAPFRGIVYNPTVIGNHSDVICPPYDVIPPTMQQGLYDSSRFNAIRLELPMEEDPYTAAAERLREWLMQGILVQDDSPAIYPYFQTFEDNSGVSHTRRGFFCALRLYEFSEKKVLPHEKTLSGPKADRLNLFRKTKANISSIFGLYADETRQADAVTGLFAETHEPLIDAVFQGVRNRMWRITDPEKVQVICSVLGNLPVYIADGHHRYETGVAYRNECAAANPFHDGTEPYNFILAYLANIHDEGLIIFPIHRLVHGIEGFDPVRLIRDLERFFSVKELDGRDSLREFLEQDASSQSYGVVTSEGVYGITLNGNPSAVLSKSIPPSLQQLGVVVLHDLILNQLLGISLEAMAKQTNLIYVKDDREVFDAVASGKVQAGIVVKPTTVGQVLAVSESGEVMPQKSTYFYPKIMTGMVIHSLEG